MSFITQGRTNAGHLFVLAVIAILAGGFLVGLIQISECPYSQPSSQAIKTEIGHITDWEDYRIYRNEEYGFEFEYPESWNMEDNLRKDACCLNLFDSEDPYEIAFLREDIMKAQFQYRIDKSILNKQAYIEKLIKKEPGSLMSSIENKNALDVIKFKNRGGNTTYIIPVKDDFSEVIYVAAWNSNRLFEKALYSFRFLD